MNDEKTQNETMEAFSFRKGVVKISGKWIRFGSELENLIKRLSVGDEVDYIAEGGTLKWIEKKTAKQAVPALGVVRAPIKAPTTASVPVPTTDTRNRSIERQVALKAAVELAGLYSYRSTKECLDVAASFAAWIEAGGLVAASPPAAYLHS